MRFALAASLLLCLWTGGCCLSEASVRALEARVDAENDAAEKDAMAKAWKASHLVEVTPRVVTFTWHTPRVPETAFQWSDSSYRPDPSDELLLTADHEADLRTTWAGWGNLVDARTTEGAPVLLVRFGVRFGQDAAGRLVRFVPAPLQTVRRVHSCGTCGGGMPNPWEPIVRDALFYVFPGRRSSEMRTVEVRYDSTEVFIHCDHQNPS